MKKPVLLLSSPQVIWNTKERVAKLQEGHAVGDIEGFGSDFDFAVEGLNLAYKHALKVAMVLFL